MTVKDWVGRFLRTVIQFVAGGGLTIAIDQIVKDLDPKYVPYVLVGSVLLVNICQNFAEEMGWIPTILKPASPPAPKDVEPVQ